MDAVSPHVRFQFDFTHDERILGKDRAASFIRVVLRLRTGRNRDTADSAYPTDRLPSAARGIALLENVLQHVDDFARVGPLQFDELALHRGRSDIEFLHHFDQLAQNVRALGHEQAGGFRQGQDRRLPADAGEILREHSLQFLRVRIAQAEEDN